ncbi:MAG: hypothetical protein QOJ35_2859 [Solirubrobacteraceae bacterium]|nr:hypothetical protein [Solirubrobacteraceae bacterium]
MRTTDPSFTGWWISISIGFVVVVVVVILVAMILTYAARILDQATTGIAAMDMARSNTDPVWGLQDINVSATNVWRTAERARRLLEEERDAHHAR